MKRSYVVLVGAVVMLMVTSIWLYAQEQDSENTQEASSIEGWAGLRLGMSYDEAMQHVKDSDRRWLQLKTEVHSEIIAERELYTIELLKSEYIQEAFLQFNRYKQLYLIRIVFDKRYFSYVSLKKRLSMKYGKPRLVRYTKTEWQVDTTALSLDRQCTLRYLEKALVKEALPISDVDKQKKRTVQAILDSL